MRQRCRFLFILVLALSARQSFAAICDAAHSCDSPTHYYDGTVVGGTLLTGSNLKSALHTIISPGAGNPFPVVSRSYTSANAGLQITDADPNSPGHMITVYDRVSLNVAAINPGGSPPGWDSGATWNKEHTWPQSRGVGDSGPDTSDEFLLRPALSATNGGRGNKNYGGAYGSLSGNSGVLTDTDGHSYFYPGNADAGMIARQEFFLAVRYNGTETNTTDLEIGVGDPVNDTSTTEDAPPQLGNLTRLIEWNYAATPDAFERNRNQLIYGSQGDLTNHALNPTYYQGNRDPFVDHPEWVWSVFMGNTNDSQIAVSGGTTGADGGSTKNVDLGRVFTGAAVPAAQSVTVNKSGLNGTYYSVTAAGAATSTLSGSFNAFRTNQTDTKTFSVGLNTNTTTAGLRSGTVTVDNLDITTGGGLGHGAQDANDTLNVSLTVLDHATPSWSGASAMNTLTYDFGTVTQGSADPTFNFNLFDYGTNPTFTAGLDFDSIAPSGDSSVLTTDLTGSAGLLSLAGGASHAFMAMLDTASAGMFSATYTLMLSDENIAGALNKSLTLTLTGNVSAAATLLAGDYNGDGIVDASDYVVWRSTFGATVPAHSGADGDGSGMIDDGDYFVWSDHFGNTASGSGAGASARGAVPEPGSWLLISIAAALMLFSRRSR